MGCCSSGSTQIEQYNISNRYKIEGEIKPGYQPVADKFETLFNRDFDKVSQLCVYVGEEKVIDLYGVATGFKGDGDSLANIYSSGKSVAAILIAIMVDQGHLEYDELISKYWPEFAQNGKEKIRVRDVMAHESGLQVTGPFEKSMFSTEKIKQNSLGSIIEKDHCDFKSANKLADLKTNYDHGALWGTWSDEKESDFYTGQVIQISKNMTWQVDGSANVISVT